MPNEVGGTTVSIWIAVIGVISLLISAVLAPIAIESVKARIARRSGTPTTPPTSLGLNGVIDPTAPGVTGFSLEDMLKQMTSMQRRLDEVEVKNGELEAKVIKQQQTADYHVFVYRQAIEWGVHAVGDPPRPVPDFLKAFLESGNTP